MGMQKNKAGVSMVGGHWHGWCVLW